MYASGPYSLYLHGISGPLDVPKHCAPDIYDCNDKSVFGVSRKTYVTHLGTPDCLVCMVASYKRPTCKS